MKDVQRLAEQILSLSARELLVLNRLLDDSGGEPLALGAREPRRPSPESPGDAVAVELPEDYWESAQ